MVEKYVKFPSTKFYISNLSKSVDFQLHENHLCQNYQLQVQAISLYYRIIRFNPMAIITCSSKAPTKTTKKKNIGEDLKYEGFYLHKHKWMVGTHEQTIFQLIYFAAFLPLGMLI